MKTETLIAAGLAAVVFSATGVMVVREWQAPLHSASPTASDTLQYVVAQPMPCEEEVEKVTSESPEETKKTTAIRK